MSREGRIGHRHEGRHHHDERSEEKRRGAKTFRRKKALLFLAQLETKRDILKKQLETPELQSINLVLVGELKALDAIIAEYVQLFDLHEVEDEPNVVLQQTEE
ncbi:MAG: hypothetical protein ABS951_00335 [Solibacillus sp.]